MMDDDRLKEIYGDPHYLHVKGLFFQKGCEQCAKFIGHYMMSGRKWRED